MAEPEYFTLRLPAALGRKLDKYIAESDEGFRSKAELVAHLIRTCLPMLESAKARDDERPPGERPSRR